MVRLTIAAALVLLIAGPAFTQNLLTNPGFDDANQLAGWTCNTIHGDLTWSSEDRSGSTTSGSMQHDLSAAGNNLDLSCSQCVPITELTDYVASMWYFWPDDADVAQDGSARITTVFYADAGCNVVAGYGPFKYGFFPGQPLDTWLQLKTDEGLAPAGSVAALVTVVTWQDLADEPVRARIDDIVLAAVIPIFSDDFESGGIGAWSSSVP